MNGGDNRVARSIVGGVGLLFLLVGLAVLWEMASFVRRSESVMARVSGVEAVADPAAATPTSPRYIPRLEFTDASGRTHQARGDVSRRESSGGTSFTHSGWTVGDTVAIRYERANPENVRMGGAWSWLLPGAFVVLGAVAVLVARRIDRG